MSQHTGGLVCPACRVDLVMSERSGVEIDYCPRCRGVWLDRGELDKILERGAAELGSRAGTQSGEQHRREQSFTRHDSDEYPAYGHGGHGKRRSFLHDLFD
jgi:Zn-finger nucleic acid-binding protein